MWYKEGKAVKKGICDIKKERHVRKAIERPSADAR